MNITIGDYKIETDSLQFIVKSKKVIEESRLTKQENIGKEVWKAVAYCTNFNSALKFIPQEALKDNNDIVVIKEKLEQIKANIKAIDKLPIISFKEENKIDIEELEKEGIGNE